MTLHRGGGALVAGHESTRTTQLYNRLQDEVSLDEIERIHSWRQPKPAACSTALTQRRCWGSETGR